MAGIKDSVNVTLYTVLAINVFRVMWLEILCTVLRSYLFATQRLEVGRGRMETWLSGAGLGVRQTDENVW